MLKKAVRAVLPESVRARLRYALADFPIRLRDLPRDAAEAVSSGRLRLPPARLRSRVGRTSSREDFLTTGATCAADVYGAFARAREGKRPPGRWLDFGCGCGRIARHLLGKDEIAEIEGVDVDAVQVAWAARNLPGAWTAISPDPPTPLPSGRYDVVFSVSVFTHLDEAQQEAWLEELYRLLAPGGLLIASTHAPRIADDAFALTPEQHRTLDETGFLFVGSDGPFNSQATFHSESYLRSVWSERFDPVLFLPAGLGGYQDLSVWSKRAE